MERKYTIVRKDKAGLDPTRVPTSIEIAWTAGIYEGEGSCVASGGMRKDGGRSFNVCITQKDPEFLYKIRKMFGGSIKLRNVGKEKKFPIYWWTCSGDRGRIFISLIYPYLTERRKAQIIRTSVWEFVGSVQEDLSRFQKEDYASAIPILLERIEERKRKSKIQADEHSLDRHREFDKKRYSNPTYVSGRNARRRELKRLKKEQLQLPLNKIVAIT